MSGESKLKEVFGEAIDRRGAERVAFLDAACAGDEGMRRRVEVLIAAAEAEGVFLNDATMELPGGGLKVEGVGTRIGQYKLMQLIGEGGFGSVFLAEQEKPVRRRVALKIIKLGMDTKTVVARFEQERQALAMMDHPGIAKVLDAGATEAGRPYFVMDLVKGDPITVYCDKNNLTIPERLELFTQVCHAVQHAHTKGVIHRDLKPSNILVTTQDGRAQARVIDFGIAKATDRRLIDKTIFTEFRQLIGTPEYMSPEQAEGGLDVDTRSDVYSLGVLLYELLAGVTPFDPERLRSAAFGEMQRIIREVDPPSPSTRISKSIETLADVAAKRRLEPRRLSSVIRGELDWIVMRALDKDRGRRYDSPGNLAADIGRFLTGEAVVAAPASVGYKLRKAARRHKVGVTAAGFVALALIAGLGASLWQAGVAARERDAARLSAADALKAKNDAEARRKETQQVAEFQAAQLAGIDVEKMGRQLRADLLADARDSMQRSGVATAEIQARQERLGQLLDDTNLTNVALKSLDANIFGRALTAVNEQFKDQPVVKASLLQTLAATFVSLGLLDKATGPQAEALEIRRRVLGKEHRDTLESIAQTAGELQIRGKFEEAEVMFRDLTEVLSRIEGEESRLTLNTKSSLALCLLMQHKMAEGEPMLREVAATAVRVLGPDDADTLGLCSNLGGLLCESGRLVEAEQQFRRVLEGLRRSAGDDDADTCRGMNNLAIVIDRQGRLAESEPLYREALTRSLRVRGVDHQDTLLYRSNVGFLLYEQGRYAEAESETRESLERRLRVMGSEQFDTAQSEHNLGVILRDQGKFGEAEQHLKSALEKRKRLHSEGHPQVLQTLSAMGVFWLRRGELDKAGACLTEALDKRRAALGNEHLDTLESAKDMGDYQAARQRMAEAEALYREAAAGFDRNVGPADRRSAEARDGLGVVLTGLGRFEEAEACLRGAFRVMESSEGVSRDRRSLVAGHLGALYESWDKAAPGKGHDVKAKEWMGKK